MSVLTVLSNGPLTVEFFGGSPFVSVEISPTRCQKKYIIREIFFNTNVGGEAEIDPKEAKSKVNQRTRK